MKYGSVAHTRVKTLKIRNFKGGLDSSTPDFTIADNSLTESKNMLYKKGILSSREGLFADTNNIIKCEEGYEIPQYSVLNEGIYMNGEYKKIAIEKYLDSDSHLFLYIFFVGSDGGSTSAGNLMFNRTSSEIFHKPENLLFYSGKATNGSGIYALVTTADENNPTDKSYFLYELNREMTGWSVINSFYTPVVYINGRGTKYEEARDRGTAFTGKPTVLESQNLLTSRFKAYFTSDGCSSSFRLPLSDLNDENIICEFYTGPFTRVEWRVTSGDVVDTAQIGMDYVKLTVDRIKGLIYFTSEGVDYPLPFINTFHENNICITAGKEVGNGLENIISSTCVAQYNSKIIFSGGRNLGKVFCVSEENPLYFPKDSAVSVGSEEGKINALLSYKDGVLAFKEKGIYSLSVNEGSVISRNALLADNPSVFYNPDKITVKCLNENYGCKNKNTLLLCGKTPVWQGADGGIYVLNVSSGEVNNISSKIENNFKNKNLISAFTDGAEYGIIYDNGIFIYNLKDMAWRDYSFSDISLKGAVDSEKGIRFFCVGSDERVLYTAFLNGEKDSDLTLSGKTEKNFISLIKTKSFDFGSITSKKLIESIFLSVSSGKEIKIELNGYYFDTLYLGGPDLDYVCGNLKSVKLMPHLSGLNSVNLTLTSENGFSLGELMIYYREAVN